MEDIFGQIECRSKSDSIVMRILGSAMDKVHEKLQSKDGPIEFLHERSTFYELAAILVDGGLSIVHEETEILEDSDKILSDLMEIKDWLEGRIQYTKELIVEKDRELTERLHNELKLQAALELKDRELFNLHEKLDPGEGFVKNEEPDNSPTSRQVISKLKNAVDLQMSNIKQKLEDERKSFAVERRTRKSRLSSPNLSFDPSDRERSESSHSEWFSDKNPRSESSRPDQNVLIRRMSSDIDILKETLDLAFGRMQSLPLEKQWRWTIENDIESILVKGFMSNLQESFDVELKNRVGLLKDNWFDFIDEMRFLCGELKSFFTPNDAQENLKPFPRVHRANSLPDMELGEDSEADDGTNRVAKMIKNHELIIRKQSEEWNWVTRDVIGRSKTDCKENSDNGLERRIQDAITRLDNLIERSRKLVDQTGDSRNGTRHRRRRRSIPRSDKRTKRSSTAVEEIEKLKEERNGLCFQISVIEDTYQLLFRGMVRDVRSVLCSEEADRLAQNESVEFEGSISTDILLHNYLESNIRADLYVVFFRETLEQWKKKKKSTDECLVAARNKKCVKEKRRETDSVSQECIESLLKEDIYMVFFREMAQARRPEEADCALESLIREDIYHFVIAEALRDHPHTIHLMEPKPVKQVVSGEDAPRSRRSSDADNGGEEGAPRSRKSEDGSLVRNKLDSLLKCVEAEEDLMLCASSEIKEHSASNSLVILNCEEVDERRAIEWLITDDASTFSSVSRKLEGALQQVYASKEVLADMEQSLGVRDERDQQVPSIGRGGDGDASRLVPAENVLAAVVRFQQAASNIERALHENLESKCLRLELLKREVDALAEPVALMRTRKLIYKRAFLSRCHNLKLAETEVDLLGDQVEALLCLLEPAGEDIC